MGLSLEVGYLVDMLQNDEEGAEWFQSELKKLNGYLISKNLVAHVEPIDCEIFSHDMYGYSGLHYLRRFAAYLDLRSSVPPPAKDVHGKDPVIQEYFDLAEKKKPSVISLLFAKARKKARSFDHLMLHSDAEGYYLPQDFESVLFPPSDLEIPGGMIGSSQRLREECQRLAAALELPLDLDPETDEVWRATEAQAEAKLGWQRFGIESHSCLLLYRAAEHSIKTGAAIVFC
jgi:hypothetical protein